MASRSTIVQPGQHSEDVVENYFTLLRDIRMTEQNGQSSKVWWLESDFSVLDMEAIDQTCRHVLENTEFAGEICSDLFPKPPVKCEVVDKDVRRILGDPSNLLQHIEAETYRWMKHKFVRDSSSKNAKTENVETSKHSTSLPITNGKRRISHYNDREQASGSVRAGPSTPAVNQPFLREPSAPHNVSRNMPPNNSFRRHESFDTSANNILPAHNRSLNLSRDAGNNSWANNSRGNNSWGNNSFANNSWGNNSYTNNGRANSSLGNNYLANNSLTSNSRGNISWADNNLANNSRGNNNLADNNLANNSRGSNSRGNNIWADNNSANNSRGNNLANNSWTSNESLPEAKRTRMDSRNEGTGHNSRRSSTSDVRRVSNHKAASVDVNSFSLLDIQMIVPYHGNSNVLNQSLPTSLASRRSSYRSNPRTPMASTPIPSTPMASTPIPSTPLQMGHPSRRSSYCSNPRTPMASTPMASTPIPSTPSQMGHPSRRSSYCSNPRTPMASTPIASTLSQMGPPSSLPPSRRSLTRYHWEQ